jgi:hypothetical protein
VKAQPNSQVCLLGVDQSVLILKSGNDIAKETVLEEILQYTYPNQYNSFFNNDPRYDTRFFEDFDGISVSIITNAKDPFRNIFNFLLYNI